MALGQNFFRTFKGLSELKLYNTTESNLIYNLPVPLDVAISNGTQERRIPTRNIYGEQVFAEAFTQARDPMLRVVFPTLTAEVIEFQTERKFAAKTGFTYKIARTYEVDSLTPDANANLALNLNLGGTVTATAVEVSGTKNHLSEVLTSITPGVPSAVLASGTAQLSSTGTTPNIVNTLYLRGSDFVGGSVLYSNTISVLITVTNDVKALSTTLGADQFKMYATLVTTENEVVVLTAPKVKPSFQNSQFSPTAEQVEVMFYMYTPSGQCSSYDIIYTGLSVNC